MADMMVRRLTPLECTRLQGFPDGWTDLPQSDSAQYKQLGNSVAVPVFTWALRRLVAADEKVRAALDPDVSSGLLSDSATATTEDQCHST